MIAMRLFALAQMLPNIFWWLYKLKGAFATKMVAISSLVLFAGVIPNQSQKWLVCNFYSVAILSYSLTSISNGISW